MSEQRHEYISDEPGVFDSLKTSYIAEDISNLILTPSKKTKPTMIGIYGNWGSGKSSLIKSIKKRVEEKEQKILWITFNTWEHIMSDMEDLKKSFLSSIIDQTCNQTNQNCKELKNLQSKILGKTKTIETSIKNNAKNLWIIALVITIFMTMFSGLSTAIWQADTNLNRLLTIIFIIWYIIVTITITITSESLKQSSKEKRFLLFTLLATLPIGITLGMILPTFSFLQTIFLLIQKPYIILFSMSLFLTSYLVITHKNEIIEVLFKYTKEVSYEENTNNIEDNTYEFKLAFIEIIKEVRKRNFSNIVIVIEDMDRIPPDKLLDAIRIIRVFSSFESIAPTPDILNTVTFIVPIGNILKVIKQHPPHNLSAEIVNNTLEKLFDITYIIPTIGAFSTAEAIKKIINQEDKLIKKYLNISLGDNEISNIVEKTFQTITHSSFHFLTYRDIKKIINKSLQLKPQIKIIKEKILQQILRQEENLSQQQDKITRKLDTAYIILSTILAIRNVTSINDLVLILDELKSIEQFTNKSINSIIFWLTSIYTFLSPEYAKNQDWKLKDFIASNPFTKELEKTINLYPYYSDKDYKNIQKNNKLWLWVSSIPDIEQKLLIKHLLCESTNNSINLSIKHIFLLDYLLTVNNFTKYTNLIIEILEECTNESSNIKITNLDVPSYILNQAPSPLIKNTKKIIETIIRN